MDVYSLTEQQITVLLHHSGCSPKKPNLRNRFFSSNTKKVAKIIEISQGLLLTGIISHSIKV